MRLRTCHLLALLCVAAGWLALADTPAMAVHVDHSLEGSFDGSDAPGGAFQWVFGVATDDSGGPSDGDVYVENVGAGFTSSSVVKVGEDGRFAGLELDGSNTPEGSFSFFGEAAIAENGIAVDDSAGPNAGDLYVADSGHEVIDRFSESGEYLCQITGKTTPSPSECNWPAGSETPQGGFAPGGIAVSPTTGLLYVSDTAHNVIDEFTATGAFAGQIVDSHLEVPTEIAVDPSGALYVVNGVLFEALNVVEFDASGAFVSVLDEGEPTGLALDRSSGDVYVSHGFAAPTIDKYDSSGVKIASFPMPEAKRLTVGIAVSSTSGRVYAGAADIRKSHSKVHMFSPDTIVPDTVIEASTDLSETDATLQGEVVPDPAAGDAIACRFEYGTGSDYGQSVPCSPPPPYTSATAVSAHLSGLSPSATDHFRLAATSGPVSPYTKAVPGLSDDHTVSTLGPPTVDEESTEDLEQHSGTLKAKVNPHGFDTEVRFEYVDAEHFEVEGGFASAATRSTPFSQLGPAVNPLVVNQAVGGLEPGTTYHFRAVVVSARGQDTGPDRTFVTVPAASIGRQWAYQHIANATVEAKIDPLGLDATCRVQYASDAEFQARRFLDAASSPCRSGLGSGNEDVTSRATIEGLKPSTKYHFRFLVMNESGTTPASDKTFETFGIRDFSIESIDEEGNLYTQAGGHPYEKIIHYSFNRMVVPGGSFDIESAAGLVKDTFTELPPGASNAREEAAKKCPAADAAANNCPADSQVGVVTVEGMNDQGARGIETAPIYAVVPPAGVASRYATTNPFTPSDTSVRSATDYGTTSHAANLRTESRVLEATIIMWGIPADHVPSATHAAILRNPTNCNGPQTARMRADTWEDPGRYVTASIQLPANTGCDKLEFRPSIEWRPTSPVADSPTGLHVDIHQSLNTNPDELSSADLSDVTMRPAKGLVFNPAGANGLVGCTSSQFGLHEETPARCPDAAKIGRVEIDTPLLNHSLVGGIYMAQPHDNPFDSTFAIYLAVADPESGVVVKLPGEIRTNPHDGQLTAAFAENPQLPVEDFKLDFFAGPRSMLRTPLICGVYPTESTLTPWSAPQSGPPAEPTDTYAITGAPNGRCVRDEAEAPNEPKLRAGTVDPSAGAYSPFVMRLSREDGSQQIAEFSVSPPPGLLGRLAGIPHCPESAIAAAAARSGAEERAMPSCPAGSKVGTVVVAAGAGGSPYYENGNMYIGDSYRGAPLSMVAIVPILAGPFDFGTVVVRTPLRVDLETGQVGVHTDPIPTILEGVPLDIRSFEVKLDRPGFTVNPTSCGTSVTTAAVTSTAGSSAQASDPFRTRSCRKLGFAPKIRLSLLGSHRRRAHPALHAVVKMPEGGANIAQVTAAMPLTEFLDNAHIRGICSGQQFQEEQCPADSVYGYAKAWSPLLDHPLAGPIYMRSAANHLPDLVADLNGEFHLALSGQIGATGGAGIGADIGSVPDVPVSKFAMTLFGRSRGLLQNSVDLCANREQALVKLKAQNGKLVVLRPRIHAHCP